MAKLTARFLNNFIIDVVQTFVDNDGDLQTTLQNFHVELGDTHTIDQFHRHEDGKVDLHFPDDSPFAGVALRVESDYVAINEPIIPKVNTGGCGGCGGKVTGTITVGG